MRNGAGNTTTMRMILGLDGPTQGPVTVGGRSYRDLPGPMREAGALLDAKALHGCRRARGRLLRLAHSLRSDPYQSRSAQSRSAISQAIRGAQQFEWILIRCNMSPAP